MTREPDERSQLEHLLGAVRDGVITPEETAELDRLVRTSPRARAYYLEYASLYAILRGDCGLTDGLAIVESLTPDRAVPRLGRRVRRITRAAGWAVAASLLVAAGAWYGLRTNAPPAPGEERGSGAVAVVARTIDAVWEAADRPVGAGLPPDRVRLASGFAQIECAGGAVVVVEGPAEWEVRSADHWFCREGKLWVRLAPGGRPLTVETPACTVVDRGTEFGLRVEVGGRSEVHVFEGKVNVQPAYAPPGVEVAAGRAVVVAADGRVRTVPVNEADFVSVSDLGRWPLGEAARGRPAWAARSAKLRGDPRVLIYYPCDDSTGAARVLRNRAPGDRRDLDATVTGGRWADGRWPGKSALELQAVGDGARVHAAERVPAVTLAAWVRVTDLKRRYNALYMADGWTDGCFHWQIDSQGRMVAGMRGAFDATSQPVVRPDLYGQWVHLAVTCDLPAGVVVHYLNGSPVTTTVRKAAGPAVVGPATLGHWGSPLAVDPNPVRTFHGRIDEFLLFREALTQDDVRSLYLAGRADP